MSWFEWYGIASIPGGFFVAWIYYRQVWWKWKLQDVFFIAFFCLIWPIVLVTKSWFKVGEWLDFLSMWD